MSEETNSTIISSLEQEIPIERTNDHEDQTQIPAEKNPNRSTGPRTAGGKRRSSQNAYKHGFFSKEILRFHLRKEDRRGYRKTLKELCETWDPVGESEKIQIELIAFHLQQLKRVLRLMTARRATALPFVLVDRCESAERSPAIIDRWLQDLPPLDELDRFQRYQDRVLRNYYQGHSELERLQKMRCGEHTRLPQVDAEGRKD